MLQRASQFISRLRLFRTARESLDVLLSTTPPPEASLSDRLHWLADIFQWVRASGSVKTELDLTTGEPQANRIRYLLFVLDRQHEWRKRFGETFSSILGDTQALELFVKSGIPNEDDFLSALWDRLQTKIFPTYTNEKDIAQFFEMTFSSESDTRWIAALDVKTWERLSQLFAQNPEIGAKFLAEAREAIVILSAQVLGIAAGFEIRKRIDHGKLEDLPFYRLNKIAESLVAETDADNRLALAFHLEKALSECVTAMSQVYTHLSEYGVSVGIVFQMERMEASLRRILELSQLIIRNQLNIHLISQFLEVLIESNIKKNSLSSLFSETFSLVSRKISERTAETGEHYITRNAKEYWSNFKSALGGGFLTAFTVLVKFLTYGFQLAGFAAGFLNSINYSVSFLAIYFFGGTLATKQPAMTAPALAAKMHQVDDPQSLSNLVDEIIHLLRTQSSAVFGNVLGVVPTMLLFTFIFSSGGFSIVDHTHALKILESFSFLGPTPLYAAFTGTLLFSSSIIADRLGNWFAYRQMSTAMAKSRRLIFLFGPVRARAMGLFLKKNISAIAANISLGILLGFTPAVMTFFNIPLDVRHVTLSSGSLAMAMYELGLETMRTSGFWLACAGIASMAFLNIGVSFACAMAVAIRARRVESPQRSLIYRAVLKRILKRPLSLVLAPKQDPR